eukprot:Nitzschia sp. Nitz4//scaffold66_size103028//37925//43391//NITZ4_004496-RA/size103028-snap-gene-0.138-mRNA-1//-1//CDS//3329556344//3834//frame0
MSLQTQLSSFMPVAKAVSILGEENVTRAVASLLRLTLRNHNRSGSPSASASEEDEENVRIQEQASFFVQAMLYRSNSLSSTSTTAASSPVPGTTSSSIGSTGSMVSMGSMGSMDTHIPPPIRRAWEQLQSRPMLLDMTTFTKFFVPCCVQPHEGPRGHMSLFRCLFYALQVKPATSTASGVQPAPTSAWVSFPDVLIFLAICHNYRPPLRSNMNDPDDTAMDDIPNFSGDDPAVHQMAQLVFLVYDAYQKKGVLVRDTVQRFLSDVHGEESYKTPPMRDLLDAIFKSSSPVGELSSHEFAAAILSTVRYTPQPSHVLLDWLAGLAQGMHPPEQAMPLSTQAFLQTIENQLRRLPKLCKQYAITEQRLYEVKRRFHSLVPTAASVIQGDPMSEDPVADATAPPPATPESAPVDPSTVPTLPKHVIPTSSFLQAVSSASHEQGHGGFLPPSLAQRVFEGVVRMAQTRDPQTGAPLEKIQWFWDLAHVLQFGGMCVRSSHLTDVDDTDDQGDGRLVQWIVQELLMVDQVGVTGSEVSTTEPPTELGDAELSALVRLLCEHKEFRLQVDQPEATKDSKNASDTGGEQGDEDHPADDDKDDSVVSFQAAKSLGLLPEGYRKPASDKTSIPVQTVVQEMKQSMGVEIDTDASAPVTMEQFLAWHKEKRENPQRGLGPFIMELRLIVSIVFGVPPKMASMEKAIIAEVEQRHQKTYPQTQTSRRGPRGTVWYIIDDGWLRTWRVVVDRASGTPEDGNDLRDSDVGSSNPRRVGRISNRGLLEDGGSLALLKDIKWRQDYEILPPLAWSALQAWYDGGPPIHRSVVPYSPTPGSAAARSRQARPNAPVENEIELFPFFVTLYMCDAITRGEARPFQQGAPVSRVVPTRVLLVQLCKDLDVDPEFGRLWVMDTSPVEDPNAPRQGDYLLDLDLNVAEQRRNRSGGEGIGTNLSLLLEIKDEESGLWPRGEDGKSWTFTRPSNGATETGDGIVGLYNMGNTCYLNSSIQCLSHTPIFRDYFTSKCYLKDINTTNPLGHQGHLAQVSAVLINSLWKKFNQQGAIQQPKRVIAPGSYALVNAPALTPKTFKDSLGKFNELFSGNEQHDAQELLAFLLDGLSEDLNRIVNKPYIQAPDSDGRPDSELADIWWSNHLKREMSIIVALFTGQYKSLLKCKTCSYESARFEPFSFLQIPLPEDDTIPVSLVLHPVREGVDSMKYCVRVHNSGTLYDVLISLAKVLYTDEQKAIGIDVNAPGSKEVSAEEKEKLEAIYRTKASNLVVVDMHDGYIFRIAPNFWRLPSLQNKETGELPLLFVYELDPLPELVPPANDESEEAEASKEELEEEARSRLSFLALTQRRAEVTMKDGLHPLSHRVFGTPLILRVTDLDKMTGRDLYDTVAQHLKNFVPTSALKFLQPSAEAEDNVATKPDKDQQTKLEARQNLQKTMADMEEVAAGPLPRYGFRLRLTTREGRRCALCPWYDCCVGCFIPDNDLETAVLNGDSIAIDWHLAVDIATNGFGLRSTNDSSTNVPNQKARPTGVPVKNHTSCCVGKENGQPGAVTLEDCLDAFALEEKIPEAYCSKCKDFRVQTKRMSLWRLPPVVIIHLKRFQFTPQMRRKLRDLVVFPLEGLDLSRIMATETPSTESKATAAAEGTEKEADHGEQSQEASENSCLNQDDGRSEMLYDLYGVVHHHGALSGGHYVASLKSETDGQWRLFNDAQIFEIHSRDVVDSNAYILFYIRRDVKDLNLKDFWNTMPAKEGEGLTQEDLDRMMPDRTERCVIS